MRKKVKFILILSVLVTLLSGCLGKTEINDLGIVMAVGLDKGEEEGSIKVTAQIVRPADARGSTGAPSGQTGEPIWSITASGDSIFEAMRHLGRHSSRRIYWAHNFAVVINEDLAKEGISDIIDFFTRNHQLRMQTLVAVTPDPASEVVSTMTGIEVIPGQAINDLFLFNSLTAAAPQSEIIDLQKTYLNESSQPVLARLSLNTHGISNKEPTSEPTIKQIELAGAGVFKNDKLVGTVKPEDTIGLLFFLENAKSAAVVTPCPDNPEQSMSVELKTANFQVTPTYNNNQVGFDTKLKAVVQLVEAGCPFSISDEKQVKQIEKQIEENLKGKIEKIVELAQKEYKSDFLELGETFKNRYPGEWKKIVANWEDEFTQATLNSKVEVKLTSAALLYLPTKPRNEEEVHR
ncbi:Ger(x)C family spore germination protein [Ureibacillus chungkukjangi]|uniref:Spore germination protein KC n=1 Tax=Ureibacillus chungkukjangi TaxID=1202712 RepID=A0A318TCN0_9BACL|nr:Ger(x)C family spore germination protein [Ureibacillus chungkukjangi]MCM3389426.1 Ger(x)C family spore germination protein [Ureibacillus chungkukjangi]PYF02474.1 spore germination protein KC [Ureibacillus chungkukjangi]